MPVKDFKGMFMLPPPPRCKPRYCARDWEIDVHYVVEEEEELIIIEGKTKNLLKQMLELRM